MSPENLNSLANHRLNFLKTSLNLLKGRRLTFKIEEEVDVAAANAVPILEEVTLPMVAEQVETIHHLVSYLITIRNSFWAIKNNLIHCQNRESTEQRLVFLIFYLVLLRFKLVLSGVETCPRQEVGTSKIIYLPRVKLKGIPTTKNMVDVVM